MDNFKSLVGVLMIIMIPIIWSLIDIASDISSIKKTLKNEPIRCKDCKHYKTIHCTCDGCCISPDWFCADGTRR